MTLLGSVLMNEIVTSILDLLKLACQVGLCKKGDAQRSTPEKDEVV
jgi:hypothetical protein